MKTIVSLLTVAVFLGTFCQTSLAEEKEKKATKRRGRGGVSLLSPEVQKAVPGINALFVVKGEKRKKLAELRKEILGAEEVVAARKTMRDKNASKEDKKAARDVAAKAQAAFQAKLAGVLDKGQAELIAKINASVKEVQGTLRKEYRRRIRDSKDDKEGRQKLQKEKAKKSSTLISAKVTSLLSEEQKTALKKAAARGKKRDGEKKKREVRRKKEKSGAGEGEKKKKREIRKEKKKEGDKDGAGA